MNLDVEITIQGAGEQWNTPRVLAINKWLENNVPGQDYRVWWRGPNSLHSDVMVVRFVRVDDAIAYALVWT